MRGFLLDTNIPSELARPHPDPRVADWLEAVDDSQIFLSVISIGEKHKGLIVQQNPQRRLFLENWLQNELLPWFEGRIFPVTAAVAERWGKLEESCQLRGTPLNTADGLIAATALEHELTIVTRNVKDFASLGLPVLNPW